MNGIDTLAQTLQTYLSEDQTNQVKRAYFFAEQRYVFLVTKSGPQFIIDKTLDHLVDVLDPDRFFRINRKFIIGIDAIANMFAYSKSRVKVELNPPSESEAIVSVERSGKFKQWLGG